jgi:transcriptional regulator with XRE-family HTH domain
MECQGTGEADAAATGARVGGLGLVPVSLACRAFCMNISGYATPFLGLLPAIPAAGNIPGVGGTLRDQLAQRLRRLIEERFESVNQLEQAMGKSQGFIYDALAGRKRLTIELIDDVLAALGMSAEAFFRSEPAGVSEHRGVYSVTPGDHTDELVALFRAYDGPTVLGGMIRLLVERGVLSEADIRRIRLQAAASPGTPRPGHKE